MIIVTTSFAVYTTLCLDTPAVTWKRLSSEWCSAAVLFHISILLLLLPLLLSCCAVFTLIYYYYFYHYCSAATAASTTTTPLLLHYKKEKKKQQQNNNSTVNGEDSVIFVLLSVIFVLLGVECCAGQDCMREQGTGFDCVVSSAVLCLFEVC